MIRGSVIVGVAAIVAATPSVSVAQQSEIDRDALAFGAREAVSQMDISPDGTKAVFTGAGPGRTTIIYFANLLDGSTKPILSSKADPESLRWCGFVSNSRIACRFTGTYNADGTLLGASRLISLNTDGTDVKELGQRASAYDVGLRQFDGTIIDWMPQDGRRVLMTRTFLPEGYKPGATNINRTKTGVGVVLVDVTSLKTETVEPPRGNNVSFMSDGQGHVRLMGIPEISGETLLTGRIKYSYRTANSRDWKELQGYSADGLAPLAIDVTIDSLYALQKLNGRYALYTIKLDGSMETKLVAQNPNVDIDGVVRSGDGQKVIGYHYIDDSSKVTYFDPQYESLRVSLGKALPNLPLVNFAGNNIDGTKSLLFAGSDSDPGRYYLFDQTKKSLAEILPVRPGLAGRILAKVSSISYAAKDGTKVPAYLTLPPGKVAKGLPAVVLPHGGPSSRDEWGFDWLAQFLAARGYVVIQPNYRGSAGYGDEWLQENGYKSWRTSIGDVSDAARYLVKEGIADPNRIAIVGWSYGGYAALLAAETDPTLYKSVVAIAPVTDLAMLKADTRDFINSKIIEEEIGNGPHVTEGSPLRRVGDIRVPVLLVHGTTDLDVAIRHSEQMAAALQGAGKQVEFLKFDGLTHQLDDSDARALMLSKMGTLLDRTIGH